MEADIKHCINCGDVTTRPSKLCICCIKLLQKEINDLKATHNSNLKDLGTLYCPNCEEGPDKCYCDD